MKLKPGITTTEFWITISGIVVQGALTAFGMLDAGWAAVGATILGSIYTLIRGNIKRGAQEVEAASLKAEAAAIAAGLKR